MTDPTTPVAAHRYPGTIEHDPEDVAAGELEPAVDDSAASEPDSSPLDAPAVPFLSRRGHARAGLESIFVRLVATGGVIGAGVGVAAILGSQDVRAWVIGLVVSLLSVVLAAILWSSRTL